MREASERLWAYTELLVHLGVYIIAHPFFPFSRQYGGTSLSERLATEASVRS